MNGPATHQPPGEPQGVSNTSNYTDDNLEETPRNIRLNLSQPEKDDQ